MKYPFSKEYVITQEFGENPGDYARFGMKAHNGIDFGCPTGTPVLAAADGHVSGSRFDANGYGWVVEIAHPDGLTSVYAHLSETRTAVGKDVTAGTVIGISGSTGNSTGPHLHFEVRKAGELKNGYWGAIDPRPLIEWPGHPVSEVTKPVDKGFVRVTAAGLNVRMDPSIEGQLIGRVPQGTTFKQCGPILVDPDGNWVPITVYVAAEYKGDKLLEGYQLTM
jgi:hypothetical protein